ncbi:MAG: DUF4899 domain-containing protein [Spirochaetota bacterium]
MGDNLDSAVNSLSEQTKKINIALFYTNSDMEKAKQMVAGAYKDVIAFKVKFTSSSQYGAFIVFFNSIQFRFIDSLFVVSNDYLVSNIDNMQDWRLFEKDISTSRANISDFRLINELKDKIDKAFTSAICMSVAKLAEKDTTQLSHIMQKMIQECTGLQRVDVSFEIARISSLEMELDSITTRKIDTMAAAAADEAKQEQPATEAVPSDPDEPKPGANGIRAILRSSLILSPIKGKHISELVIGDRVMVSLVEMNDQSKSVAKAFNAYDEENSRILPIPARVKSLRYIEGTGYKIFVVIAKGILGQIIEEEKNIKIMMDPATQAEEKAQAAAVAGKSSLAMIIALMAVIILLVGFIIIMVL